MADTKLREISNSLANIYATHGKTDMRPMLELLSDVLTMLYQLDNRLEALEPPDPFKEDNREQP